MEELDRREVAKFVSVQNYDEEPVHYCTRCLSLYVLSAGDTDYCGSCTATDTAVATIEEWEKMYKEKYGKTLI